MEIDRTALETQKTDLRQTLKEWEGQFHADNGRKPGRDDIKANPAIAARYKEYQKVQDLLSGKSSSTTTRKSPRKPKRVRPESGLPESSPPKRRRSLHDTPQKQQAALVAPHSNRHEKGEGKEQIEEDAEEELHGQSPNTPAAVKRTFIGPTPQKDGIVLGIFDLLPVAGSIAVTPSRKIRQVLGELDRNVAVTPSKRLDPLQQDASPGQYEERARGSRTPASTGKRFLLDQFVTPQKQSTKNVMTTMAATTATVQVADVEHTTPSSSAKFKQQFLTPAFLRRDNFVMSTIEEDPPLSPRGVKPWKRSSFGRSLSGMIQDLRKKREQEADDELDLLREMEDEAEGVTTKPKTNNVAISPPKIVVVQDSQVASGGLDRDGFVPSDGEWDDADGVEEEIGGAPRKAWKKKGLKRQTRRVNMRPVAKKVQAKQHHEAADAEEDDEANVAETQAPGGDVPSDLEAGSDEEYGDVSGAASKPKTKAGPKNGKTEGEDSVAEKKKSTRKVKPEAHANYRALKIKNKNSKGKGKGGRFGRRR